MLRVVLDLNILISAYFFSKEGAPPLVVFEAALDKRFRLLHSLEYRIALVEAFSKPKFEDRLKRINTTVEIIEQTITDLGEDIIPAPIPLDAVRDEDDVLILACAVSGGADYIVTGDDDLLTLKVYKNILILTPAEFLAILNSV